MELTIPNNNVISGVVNTANIIIITTILVFIFNLIEYIEFRINLRKNKQMTIECLNGQLELLELKNNKLREIILKLSNENKNEFNELKKQINIVTKMAETMNKKHFDIETEIIT